MRLGFLPTPNHGSSLGEGLGKLGGSVVALGQLGADEIKRKKDEETENTKMDLLKQRNERENKNLDLRDREVKLKEAEENRLIQRINDEKLSTEERKKDVISLFRKKHPKTTEGLSDGEVFVFAEKISDLQQSDDFKFLNSWTDGNKNRVVAYRENGEIKTKTIGDVYTDWNETTGNDSDDYVKVASEDFKEYGHTNLIRDFSGKSAKKGFSEGYYIKKTDIPKIIKMDEISNTKDKNLNFNLDDDEEVQTSPRKKYSDYGRDAKLALEKAQKKDFQRKRIEYITNNSSLGAL